MRETPRFVAGASCSLVNSGGWVPLSFKAKQGHRKRREKFLRTWQMPFVSRSTAILPIMLTRCGVFHPRLTAMVANGSWVFWEGQDQSAPMASPIALFRQHIAAQDWSPRVNQGITLDERYSSI